MRLVARLAAPLSVCVKMWRPTRITLQLTCKKL